MLIKPSGRMKPRAPVKIKTGANIKRVQKLKFFIFYSPANGESISAIYSKNNLRQIPRHIFMLILWVILSIIGTVAVWLGFWSLVSLIIKQSNYQKQFVSGILPQNAPDGFFIGTAHIFNNRNVPWLGKTFVASNNLGFNIFTPKGAKILKVLAPFYGGFSKNAQGNTEAFYFQTRIERGLKDKTTDVIRLDYDTPENPLPIRIILDEIVEVAPEHFLGKIHVKVFPRFYSTVGYFSLKKF